jgi:hypothetical protein
MHLIASLFSRMFGKSLCMIRFIVFLFPVALLFAACKKDYREEYVGSFDMRYQYSEYYQGVQITDTTIQYSGTIQVSGDESVGITWYDGSIWEFEIEKDGTLLKCGSVVGSVKSSEFAVSFDDNLCAPGPEEYEYLYYVQGDKK